MYFFRPMVPGDIITSVATIAAIEDEPAGESLTVEVQCNQRAREVCAADDVYRSHSRS